MTAAVKTLSVSGEGQARREMRKIAVVTPWCCEDHLLIHSTLKASGVRVLVSGRNNSFLAQLALDLGEVTVVN